MESWQQKDAEVQLLGTSTLAILKTQSFEFFPFRKTRKYSPRFETRMSCARFVIAIILVLIPCINSQTKYCCLTPNFGSGWCHSSTCLGAGCRNEPDPITKESQSNYLCDDLSNCICAGALVDRTLWPCAAFLVTSFHCRHG